MNMRVVGSSPCQEAIVELDDWIPLKVSWWPRDQVRPLYLILVGDAGGEIELKLDPRTGALLQLVVLEEPPDALTGPTIPSGASHQVGVVPLFDRSEWWPVHSMEQLDARPVTVSVNGLTSFRSRGRRVVQLASAPIDTVLRCGGVEIGLSIGMLVTIDVALPMEGRSDLT